jgi:hypothetical protein
VLLFFFGPREPGSHESGPQEPVSS